eukprot:TRINITY_DN585_c0_g4_i1.p1 TRINITY_DN585_c0_g4~~TRINITY_DN585_c0_g4_i1.p1  ORF type:complete len:375 (-),score=133.33 TRINITY_DN585_c0_g4_i1:233-1357(-)
MKLLLFVAILFFIGFSYQLQKPKWHELDGYTFEKYVHHFNKFYLDKEEREFRRNIFEERINNIREFNSLGHSYKKGINHFTDRTEQERKQVLGVDKALLNFQKKDRLVNKPPVISEYEQKIINSLPTHVDWREKNVVTAVKDQGNCGSCWSFASAQTIESAYALKTGQLAVLSEQEILSCTENPNQCGGTGGCGGGTVELAYDRILSTGLGSEWTYPYLSYQGKNFECSTNKHVSTPFVKISNYTALPSNNYTALLNATAHSPVAISVDASMWHDYEEGVFTGCNLTSVVIDHAVSLEGYGVDQNTGMPYWLVRNSWSTTFGENGYIRIQRHTSNTPCGVDNDPLDGDGCIGGPSVVYPCGSCGILFDSVTVQI